MSTPTHSKTTIVMSATGDYAFAVGNVLLGLKKHSPDLAERLIIYHQNFPDNDKKALSAILPCEFIEYKGEKLAGYTESDHFKRVTSATFATFEIFDHLQYSDYVIYLDADLMIMGDISGILDYAHPAAMRLFTQNKSGALEEMLGSNHEGRTLPDFEGNAGVVVVSRQADYSGLKELLYRKAVEYSPTNKRGDQTILNLGLFLHGITLQALPAEYNYLGFYEPFNPEARIVHQIHTEKFWNNGLVHFLAPSWADNYRHWLALGGTPYQGERRFWEFTVLEEAPLFKLMAMTKIYKAAIQDFLRRLGEKICCDKTYGYEVNDYLLSIFFGEGKRQCEVEMFDKYFSISFPGSNNLTKEYMDTGFVFKNGWFVRKERFTEECFGKIGFYSELIQRTIFFQRQN